MDTTNKDLKKKKDVREKNVKKKFSLRKLRVSLKYRPDILKLVLKMRQCIRKRNKLIKNLKQQLKIKESTHNIDNVPIKTKYTESSTQTNDVQKHTKDKLLRKKSENGEPQKSNDSEPMWELKESEQGKSIADQVKEAAQSALQQSGMVYVESAGMYYDYKTGYYYNTELGLYYHTDTGCYYYYNEDKKEFVFHSYPDRSAVAVNPSLEAHEKRKARKQKKAQKAEEDIENITKNLSQEEEPSKPKKRKTEKKKKQKSADKTKTNDKSDDKMKTDDKTKTDDKNDEKTKTDDKTNGPEPMVTDDVPDATAKETDAKAENGGELEDGECSETDSDENSNDEDDGSSIASTVSLVDDDSVAKHHPPCMRIIVRETNLPKLKVGSLFLVTKDGGTIGREGEQHTILIRDQNVSRDHLDIKYDMSKRMYLATDLGSKNGTLLNGIQMSESQVTSQPMEVLHGSTIQLGETKLLCHIHPGNDTCGHCEPGLIMETQAKEKVAYTRTCNVKKQYELELARLKNKYKPEPLMIEEGTYNDRAKARREAVGSSHHSEKTETADVETHIAPENKGFKLLEKMGWSKGEGLGKDSQGGTAPIPLVGNEGKVGLGTPGAVAAPSSTPVPKIRNTLGPATLRLASRSKLLQPPAKAFQPEDEESE